MKKIILISLCLVLAASCAVAKNATDRRNRANPNIQIEVKRNVSDREVSPVEVVRPRATTTYLAYYDFEAGGGAWNGMGWTSADMTAQTGDYFHVSDFTTPPENCGPSIFGRLYAPEGVQESGPQWFVGDIDQFQDNFPTDGTTTGTARADMAQDIMPPTSPFILPGDSACVAVSDPEDGLAADTCTGCGPAVYCYISVDPDQLGTVEKQASETRDMGAPCGVQLRYPYVFSTTAGGRDWDVYRMDSVFTQLGDLVPDRYCIDFNDDLFVPGDTCWFFYGGSDTSGNWTYVSLPHGVSASIDSVAMNPDEFTILPCGEPWCDILYVDGVNPAPQQFFDTAFENLGVLDKVDRYDVRGPWSPVNNQLASRVALPAQLQPYRGIIWNTGHLECGCIGDGINVKPNDASLLLAWISTMTAPGGIYFSGDNLAEEWATLTGAGAVALRAYCGYTVVSPDHVAFGVGVNPVVKYSPGGSVFQSTDSLIAYGGGPLINDFDVIIPTGAARQEMDYWRMYPPPPGPPIGGAIVAQTTTNDVGCSVTVILSGFSYHEIRDVTAAGFPTRYDHLYDILTGGLSFYAELPCAVPPDARRNSLDQNYPNPFNATTTIKYRIKEQAHVSLKVYNITGQLVRTLVDEVQNPDRLAPVEWRGVNNAGQTVASGVYFYRLVTRDFTQTKKMVLLK